MSPKSIQAQTAPLLLAVLLLIPAIGHARPPDVSLARAADLSEIGIDNFGRVNASYYRGAEPDDDRYATLAALGIKTVVRAVSTTLRQPDSAFTVATSSS